MRFTPSAQADLEAIVVGVGEDCGPDEAEMTLEMALSSTTLLAEYPGSGHLRLDSTDEPVLVWCALDFLVYYRPDTRPIQVVRVLRESRDPRRIRRSLRRGGAT